MKAGVIVDTGPLVAFLNRRDRYHAWATRQLERLAPPLLTCEPVISEACFLLRNAKGGSGAVLALIERGLVRIGIRIDDASPALLRLIARYSNVPMSLADACLVHMAEQREEWRVMTLDGDFHIYRLHARQAVPTLAPDDLLG